MLWSLCLYSVPAPLLPSSGATRPASQKRRYSAWYRPSVFFSTTTPKSPRKRRCVRHRGAFTSFYSVVALTRTVPLWRCYTCRSDSHFTPIKFLRVGDNFSEKTVRHIGMKCSELTPFLAIYHVYTGFPRHTLPFPEFSNMLSPHASLLAGEAAGKIGHKRTHSPAAAVIKFLINFFTKKLRVQDSALHIMKKRRTTLKS